MLTDDFIMSLTPDQLLKTADELERQAKQMRLHAGQESAKIKKRQALKRHRQKKRSIIDMMAEYFLAGHSADQTLDMIARQTGQDRSELIDLAGLVNARINRQKRQIRNRDIMVMYRAGFNNSEIGRKFGLHATTVGEIIRKFK